MILKLLRRSAKPAPQAESSSRTERKTPSRNSNVLKESVIYRFKHDALMIVANMNHGVAHTDCDILRRQTMFVQTQLLHSLINDPAFPGDQKIILMEYHSKSVRATVGEKRAGKSRDQETIPAFNTQTKIYG